MKRYLGEEGFKSPTMSRAEHECTKASVKYTTTEHVSSVESRSSTSSLQMRDKWIYGHDLEYPKYAMSRERLSSDTTHLARIDRMSHLIQPKLPIPAKLEEVYPFSIHHILQSEKTINRDFSPIVLRDSWEGRTNSEIGTLSSSYTPLRYSGQYKDTSDYYRDDCDKCNKALFPYYHNIPHSNISRCHSLPSGELPGKTTTISKCLSFFLTILFFNFCFFTKYVKKV